MGQASNEEKESCIRWLHLSDIHVGMLDQDWLWPALKHVFLTDIANLHAQVGPWEVVIFSGDLTQTGSPEEFQRFQLILQELWLLFRQLGFSPKLIVLPGNHDVVRAPLGPELRVLRRWWEEPGLSREFFEGTNRYQEFVKSAFAPYSEWSGQTGANPEPLRGTLGLLPGDQSFELEAAGVTIGVVNLNSAWLQLDGDEYEERLHVDVKQLLSVTGGDAHAWCARHDFNILVTHHPLSWLHPNSQSLWNSDINPAGRFDVHLFGHLHEAAVTSLAAGGSPPRNSIQAPSIFGLTHTGGGLERLHGYSLVQATKSSDIRSVRIWPRTLQKLQSGGLKLVPNQSFDLDFDGSAKIVGAGQVPSKPESYVEQLPREVSLRTLANESRDVLTKVRHRLPAPGPHSNVRKVEQRRLLEGLNQNRAAWLVAEWGMASDAFISSVWHVKGSNGRPVYRLSAAEYKNRAQFLDAIRDKLDCSFQQLCELISQSGESLLLLDDFPDDEPDREAIVGDLEDLVKVILDYCPAVSVAVRCRRIPVGAALPFVQLRSLDEADLRAYVLDHDRGGVGLSSPISIGLLLRHTDGIPARIDRTLKELEVVTLSELLNSDSDIALLSAAEDTSPSLVKSIRELSASGDMGDQRSFGLLKVLSLFPNGEQHNRIKRFYSNLPFFPKHAAQLFDLALIDVVTIQGLEAESRATVAKTLVVSKPVRECVRDLMAPDEMSTMNHRAAEIYFGSQWLAGIYKFPASYRFDDPHCGNAEIVNANTIILRLLREELAKDEATRAAPRVLGLAEFYLKALLKGSHYNSAVMFCEDFVPVIPRLGYEDKLASVKSLQARSLRMLGERERAKAILMEVEKYPFPKATRQTVLVDYALCLQSLGEADEAKRVAQEIVDIDRHSNAGLQARGILVELGKTDPNRAEKLLRIERLCRKQGATVAANNIALTRAAAASDNPAEVRSILAPVMKGARDDSDYYNKTRAALKLAKQSLDAGEKLREADLVYLVGAYQFLFNERIPGMFDQCHSSLWKSFEQSRETENLLTLFRHSSLYWRLRGNDAKEIPYLGRLNKLLGENIGGRSPSKLSREAEYYLVRSAGQQQLAAPSVEKIEKVG